MKYQVQFWYGGSVSEWRGCGEPLFTTEESARRRIAALREQSQGCVDFRIEMVADPSPSLTGQEFARATARV